MKLFRIKLIYAAFSAAVLFFVLGFAPQRYPIIYMIGDSTMANKQLEGERPERGWGQMLPGFLDSKIVVDNRSKNGRSSVSFRNEGLWQPMLDKLKTGDYVIIQFGHNDQKPDTARFSDPETSYRDNLRRYITETRAKGAIPVLCTSIARRHFNDNGELVDSHGKYIDAVRIVGAEMNVPVIDMNKSTTELIKSVPQEESKKFFMWIAPEICPALPKGVEDNTHLNVYGARVIAKLAVDEISQKVPDLAPFIKNYDMVVAKDGSGDFFTVQEAIDAVPDIRKNRTTIYIRNGVYKEKLVLPASKQNVSFIGEDAQKTVLTYDDFANRKNRFGETVGTSGSSSFYLYGNGFTAENITFSNTAGEVGQAVALYAEGDRLVFKNCRFLGFQDTLYTHGMNSRQYYDGCFIEGTVDFIFGWSNAVFNNCTINSKRSGTYLTAASTPEGASHGYLFVNCKLTADPGVEKVYLGRPWRDYARTVFVNCDMGKHILPEGWHNWGKPNAEKTTFYAEYGNSGDGANLSSRVGWSHKLTKKEAEQYTVENVLKGSDGWNPTDYDFRPKDN